MKNTEKLLAYCALGILFSMSAIVAGTHLKSNKIRKIGAIGTTATIPTALVVGLGMTRKRG